MSVDNLPGQSLALRFRHLAVELRRADGHPNADREFERLLMRMTRALKDSFNERQLPVPILNALDADKSSGLNLFWEVQLAISVVGYWDPCVYTEPYEDYDDKTRYGGQRAVFLKPGPVSSVWPGVLEDILCHDGWCCDDIDLQAIFSMALTEQRFTIIGYYATACDLLAEWIENHANDDQGDYAGDRDAVGSAALGAVVAGGLAGVLQAAVGARATDRVTAVMRQRIANDRTLYGWTQKDWADDLGASTKTISKCDAWREILDWRASNEVDRVSKETGK